MPVVYFTSLAFQSNLNLNNPDGESSLSHHIFFRQIPTTEGTLFSSAFVK